MQFDSVILMSRGGYSAAPKEQLQAMALRTKELRPDLRIEQALIDQGSPTLADALATLAEAGATSIVILPVYIPSDYNLQRWLGKVVARWHAAWVADHWGSVVQPPAVHMAKALADHDVLGDAIVAALDSLQIDRLDLTTEPPKDWENDPKGWSNIPEHTHHLLVCRGPRCTARGADRLWRKMLEVGRVEREATSRVLEVSTGCLFPCNLGPLMVVHPEGIWYGNLDETGVERIVREHFGKNEPVKEYMVRCSGENLTPHVPDEYEEEA